MKFVLSQSIIITRIDILNIDIGNYTLNCLYNNT